jgi:hypothetical protein
MIVAPSGTGRLADRPARQRTYSKEESDRGRLNHRELIDALENGNGQWAELSQWRISWRLGPPSVMPGRPVVVVSALPLVVGFGHI